MEQNGIDPEKNNIKFIFKGKILNNATTFLDFKDEQKLIIIYMVSKNKSETSNTNVSNTPTQQLETNISSSQVKLDSVQESTNTLDSNWHNKFTTNENIDNVERLRASVIATLFFIRQSPQFTELFMNNFQTLLDVLISPQLRPLFERIYNDTDLDDNEYIDNMTDHVADINSKSNSSEQVNTVTLTEEDNNNINTLVSLGFPKNASIQAYLLCNKNVELAASMLMDNDISG
jgi:hypothetical protein